jgi:hypothetical protein
VASRIGKAVARQGVEPDALAKIGCQLDGEREAGESHLNFWIETRTVLRFD